MAGPAGPFGARAGMTHSTPAPAAAAVPWERSTNMARQRLASTVALVALATVAACGGSSAPDRADGDLQRDLELAKSQQGIELLPAGSRTAVVSTIEQTGLAAPAPAPTRAKAPAARPAPRRAAPQRRVARTAAPRPERQVERPTPRPVFDANVISPPPPGGYKTVDEVIRNAPFPIKPLGRG